MSHFLQKFLFINFCVFHLFLQAQVLDGRHSSSIKKNNHAYKEKEKIDLAFSLLNNNKKKEAYTIAHQLLKKKLDRHSSINAHLLLGYYFNSKTLIDSSLYYTNKALKQSKSIRNDSLRNRSFATTYNLLALNNYKKGLLKEGKKWHLKGIEVSKKYKEDIYYRHVHGLANIYSRTKNYEEAIELFKECLTYTGDPEITYGSYINTGIIYTYLEDYNSSNFYLQKALNFNKQNKNKYAVSVIKMNLAANYQEQKNYEKAIILYNESLELAKENEQKKLAIDIQISIASVYYNLKKYKDAELILTSCIHDAIELGYLSDQKNIYNNLTDIFIAQKKYKQAFEFTTKSFHITDSIRRLEKSKEIEELEVKYKTQQKEKAIQLLKIENSNRNLELKNKNETLKNLRLEQELEKKENEYNSLFFQITSEKKLNEINFLKKNQEIQEIELNREKNTKKIILFSFLTLITLIISLLFIYYQKLQTQSELNQKQEEINTQKISSLIKDQELQIIKAQDKERKRIAKELHDSIGGNLAAIKIKVNNSISDKDKTLNSINTQIDHTYEQVRSLSHNLINKSFNENNFSDVLEEYIKGIWGTNCSFSAFPRKEIDFLNQKLQIEIFKIIQELITNTIKHAKATVIELHLNLVNNDLNILFEDNGIGFNVKMNQEGVGFGNIRNRLARFKGTFNIDSRIKRGTIINIEIPTLTTIENEI